MKKKRPGKRPPAEEEESSDDDVPLSNHASPAKKNASPQKKATKVNVVSNFKFICSSPCSVLYFIAKSLNKIMTNLNHLKKAFHRLTFNFVK